MRVGKSKGTRVNKRSKIVGRLAWGFALVAAWAAPAWVMGCGLEAHAQNGLDPAIVSASPLDAAQKAVIEKYVKDRMGDLAGAEVIDAKVALAIKKARTELTAPLEMKSVSVPFRQEYSRVLMAEKLAELSKDKKDIVAINALRLAGETAASEMLPLIAGQLADERTAVRYAAGYAAQRLFEQVAPPDHSLAVTMDSLVELVGKLSARLAKEREPLVSDLLVRTLLSAAKVERPKSEALRSAAIKAVCEGLSAGLKNAKLTDDTFLKSVVGIASELRNIVPSRGQQWTADERKDVMGLAGDMGAWAARRVAAKDLPVIKAADAPAAAAQKKEDRKTASQIVRLSEALMQSTQRAAGVANVKPIALADVFEEATLQGDARFAERFVAVVNDTLIKPPFDFKADRFK